MSEIIKKLEANPFQTVEKSNFKCPICDGHLYNVWIFMSNVMDGNAVYHCENEETHKFWNHPFEASNILHLNRHASETDFTTEQDYELIDGVWHTC